MPFCRCPRNHTQPISLYHSKCNPAHEYAPELENASRYLQFLVIMLSSTFSQIISIEAVWITTIPRGNILQATKSPSTKITFCLPNAIVTYEDFSITVCQRQFIVIRFFTCTFRGSNNVEIIHQRWFCTAQRYTSR